MQQRSAFRRYQRFLAVYTVLCGLLTAFQCAELYIHGNAPDNRLADGVYLAPVFSRESVSARLRVAAPFWAGWAVCALIGLHWQARRPAIPAASSVRPVPQPCKQTKLLPLRIALLAAAVLLTVLGVANGGLRDVLIKAIHICTECIGLG